MRVRKLLRTLFAEKLSKVGSRVSEAYLLRRIALNLLEYERSLEEDFRTAHLRTMGVPTIMKWLYFSENRVRSNLRTRTRSTLVASFDPRIHLGARGICVAGAPLTSRTAGYILSIRTCAHAQGPF